MFYFWKQRSIKTVLAIPSKNYAFSCLILRTTYIEKDVVHFIALNEI